MLLILGALLFLIVLVSVVLYVEDRHARSKAHVPAADQRDQSPRR